MKKLLILLVLVAGIESVSIAQNAPQSPTNLQLNYCIAPLGIDDPTPRFSWVVNDADRAEKQTAYEIIVASSLDNINTNIGDVWSSGKLNSSMQNGVVYNGTPLVGQSPYWWKVKTWDKDDMQSPWSNVMNFETGIFKVSDWKASFISGTFKLARKEFTIPAGKTITKARAYVTSTGYYELRINGKKIGDRVLEPLATETNALMLYSTYDITNDLNNDAANAVGLMLGGYSLEYHSDVINAICQIDIWFSDGTRQTVASDATWKILMGGPITSQHIFDGENYDARNELSGWDSSMFNEAAWKAPASGTLGLPSGWSISNGALEATGGEEVLINTGKNWTNYSFETDIKILNTCAGLVFRATDGNNYYMWQFNPGTLGLRPHKKVGGTFSVIGNNIVLPTPLILNQVYHIKIEVNGNTIKTYIADVLASTITDNTFSKGTIGYRESALEHAVFDNVKVTSNSAVVFSDDFSTGTVKWINTDAFDLKAELIPIKIDEIITPVAMTSPSVGTYIFDMGKNISGWAELNVQGAAGTVVTMRFAERLYANGTLNRSSNLSAIPAQAIDKYTLKGNDVEIWEPRFTYHGFRYVEVTGFPGIPTINSIRGKCIHSAVNNTVSTFDCSNPNLTKIYKAYKTTQLDNMMGLPTDCNQRAERGGWLADAMVTSESAMLYFNSFSFYEKWINDILVNRKCGNGSADPTVPTGYTGDDVIWESAIVSVPWDFYNMSGDLIFLNKTYSRCKSFVNWFKGLDTNNNFIFEASTEGSTTSRFNDWWPVGGNGDELKNTKDYMATLYLFHSADLLAKMAQVLGNTSDYNTYSNMAANIKNAINNRFLHTSFYDNNKQSGNALALAFGIVPPASLSNVLNTLATDVNNGGDVQLKTGCLGTYALMRSLGDNGRNDLAYQLAARTEYPGWGYMLNTSDAPGTFWETWENNDNSKNHAYLSGSVASWLFNSGVGIKLSQAGYKEITLKPDVTTQLNSASGTVNCIKGAVTSSWQKNGTNLTWNVTIPVNSSALLYIPTSGVAKITEGTTVIWDATLHIAVNGLSYLRTEGNFIVWSAGSGSYSFTVISETTAISTPEGNAKSVVGVFPNPVRNTLFVDGLKNETSMEIYNYLGQKILKTFGMSVNVESLQSGVYTLLIMPANEKTSLYKFIKD